MSAPIPAFEIDFRRRLATLYAIPGEPKTFPIPSGVFDLSTNVERVSVSSALDQLRVGLPNGEEAIVELTVAGSVAADLRADRPVIYLDQNHWSSVAATQFGHQRVSPAEAAAAGRLIALARQKKVLLPLSAGHLVETAPLYGVPRVAHATAILQVSRGWQMRSPLHVRTEEILRHIQGREPIAGEVFAPRANGLLATHAFSTPATDPQREIPIAELLRSVPAVLSLYETMVDGEKFPTSTAVERRLPHGQADSHRSPNACTMPASLPR